MGKRIYSPTSNECHQIVYFLFGSVLLLIFQEFQKILGERAVAYLNVDGAVSGNYTVRMKSTPLLYSAIYEAAQKVCYGQGAVRIIATERLENCQPLN